MSPLLLLRARRQQDELGEIAIEHREIGNLLRLEGRRHVGAIDFQQRAARDDIDALGDGTRLEAEVHRRLRVDVDDDIREQGLLESLKVCLDFVDAGEQALLAIDAVAVGHDRI